MSLIFAAMLTGCNFDGSSDPSSSSGDSTGNGSTGTSSGGGSIDIGDIDTPTIAAVDYSAIATPTVTAQDDLALQNAVAAAADGDVIGLTAGVNFASLGALTVDKKITLVSVDSAGAVIDPTASDEQALISGAGCIYISPKGAGSQVLNIAFKNDTIGYEAGTTTDNACVLSGSSGRSGVIAIDETSEADSAGTVKYFKPVILDNLNFDAELITSDQTADGQLNNKASWLIAYGQFELTNSTFTNLKSDVQNIGVYSACNTDSSKNGSLIEANTFAVVPGSSSETAAIKLGNSSSGLIDTITCNFSLVDNTFINYTALLANDVKNTVLYPTKPLPVGIFSTPESLTKNEGNTLTTQ